MSYQGRFEQAKPPKKKKGRKIALIIVIVLLVLLVAAAVVGIGIYKTAMSKINYIEMPTWETEVPTETTVVTDPTGMTEAETEATEATTVETTIPPMKPEDIINILVVGNSARGGEEAALADTMILASVNTYDKTLTLTSFLRDTYVDLPDYAGHTCGWNKLTSCYALGYSWGGTAYAMDMMNICLKNNFGVDIDYNVEVDFECFIKFVEILGGVGLEITQEEADYLNADTVFVSAHYEAGWAALGGPEALSYARMRKAVGDNDSDIKRTARQRKLIGALLNNIRQASISQLMDIMNEILPYISTNMPAEKITELMIELVPMLPQMAVKGGTCPVEKTYWSEEKDTPDGRMYVLAFDAGQNKKLMKVITEGVTAE